MVQHDGDRPEPAGAGAPSCPAGAGPTEDAAQPGPITEWPALPGPLRARLAEIAATALGGMTPPDVPAPLRRFAKFTPAKRARLGASALVGRLESDPVFRAAVVAWWAEHRPGELELPDAASGTAPASPEVPAADDLLPAPVDTLDAAAVALLTGDPLASRRVAQAERTSDLAALRAERDEALAKVDKLTAELERARAELTDERERAATVVSDRESEYQQMRRRVSDQGAKLRAAVDARDTLEAEVRRLRAGSDDRLAAVQAELDAERDRAAAERRRADAAAREVGVARRAAREARKADEVRLELLLDTIGGAVTGLRRELDVGAGGPRPADLVADGSGDGTGHGRAGVPVDGLAALDTLLGMPSMHLIVDGYNVSKTGYPDLPLADQRTRLVTQLGALAARTGVEVTVVFDGAAVVAASGRGARGVRVLFSDPGVLADDVVRDLVAAEPRGRTLLVATSDQEVVRSVRRRGAHTVPSAVLLRRLG
ncbi:NYN domain-containing protein [Pseudonocardia phyllosphaerae]|uniref:NYN domain-containing protein n=1 Tax=Pseudonocardia phyllosphaerae TaxID=3390502 RepID=UPI00397B2FD6